MAGFITRYRPQTLEEVVGHEAQIKAIKRILERPRDQIPQAWLFSGKPGVGKTTLARIVARELGAKGPGLIEINVGQDKGIQMVRDLTSRLHFKPQGSEITAIILDEVHELTEAAKNALLKPIEEPPKHVFWFLCTTEPEAVPEAIMTRCVHFELEPLSIEQLAEVVLRVAIANNIGISEEECLAIAKGADGSARQALSILDRVYPFIGQPEFFTLVKNSVTSIKGDVKGLAQLITTDRKRALAMVKSLRSSVEDWGKFQQDLAKELAELTLQGKRLSLKEFLNLDFKRFEWAALVAYLQEEEGQHDRRKEVRRFVPR